MLMGPPTTGKTTTLKLLHKTLVETYGALSGPPIKQNNDIEAVLQYKNKSIIIHSGGDIAWEQVVETIIKHSEKDIVIVASRDFSHLQGIMSRYPHKHHVLLKTISSPTLTEAAANKQDCDTMVGWI
jgi:aspartate aminotransferase-like enzyme